MSKTNSKTNFEDTKLKFNAVGFLRQRLALSLITGKPIYVNNIRKRADSLRHEKGIHDYEANLLKLIEKVTNGSVIQINEDGTSLYFKPGKIVGGTVEHNCNKDRDVAYYLEVMLWISPMLKMPLKLTLNGITNGHVDTSVDSLKFSALPVMKNFGYQDDLDIKIVKRGAPPNGVGKVIYTCPVLKAMKLVNLCDVGLVHKIRGVAYSMRVSSVIGSRMIDTAQQVLRDYIRNIHIYNDNSSGSQSGVSPGFGIILSAETTTDKRITVEATSLPKGKSESQKLLTAEDVAKDAASRLLEQIYRHGCIEVSQQHLYLLYMAMCPAHVSKVVISEPVEYTVHFLRHIFLFLGVKFRIVPSSKHQPDSAHTGDNDFVSNIAENKETSEIGRYVFSCVGSGITNICLMPI